MVPTFSDHQISLTFPAFFVLPFSGTFFSKFSGTSFSLDLWSSHTKANAKAMSFHWFLILSSLTATPSESDFTRNIARNWVQNPFHRYFAREIAFALVWPNH